jgi:hypothetical protein
VQVACTIAFLVGLAIATFVPIFVYYFNLAVAIFLVAVAVVEEIISGVRKQHKKSLYFAAVGQADELLPSEKDALKARMLEKGSPAQASSSQPVRPPSQRLWYLDHIKTFMVEAVILTHSAFRFQGIDQGVKDYVGAYRNPAGQLLNILVLMADPLMPVFFFVSGYVTPGSLTRKGRQHFIKDRLRRLGLPMGVSIFVINSAMMNAISLLIEGEGSTYYYFPDLGVAWFLSALLVFSIIYAAVADDDGAAARGGPVSPLPCPGWSELFLWTTAASAVWIFAAVVCGIEAMYFAAPFFSASSLPSYVLYFAAGCLAKTHNWLDQIPDKLGDRRISLAIFVTLSVAVFLTLWFLWGYVSSIFYGLPTNAGDDGSGRDDDGDDDLKPLADWPLALFIITGTLVFQIYCLLCTLCLLQWGPSVNSTTPFLQAISRAAFPAYLLHPFFIIVFYYIWLKIMTLEGFYPYYVDGNSSTKLPSDWDLLWGVLFVFVCTNLTSWPAAVLLTRIPGLEGIL